MSAESVMAQAISNASSMRSGASSALTAALNTLGSPPLVKGGTIPMWSTANISLADVPTWTGAPFNAPAKSFGSAPTLEPIPSADYGAAPINLASNPGFVTPAKPAALRAFSTTAPTLSDMLIPPAPSALYELNLTPPTLSEVTVPAAPKVTLPDFTAVKPDTEIAAPTDFAARFASDYANMSTSMRSALEGEVDNQLAKINPEYHAQMARLEAKLATYLAGGTAMTDEVEQAIYNRARDKTHDEYLKTRDSILTEGARRGFTIPAGAQFSALTQARQAAADNNARAAMDVAIKHAELEQQNIQFAMTTSASLRSVVLQSMTSFLGNLIQLNGQGLEYARDVMQAGIALYETLVKVVTAKIEIYKAEAQIYDIRLRSVLAVYDVYQAEIKGLEAQVNVDKTKVEAFTAQVGAYAALANAYKAVIDGVVAKGQIEKLKVDIFGAEVQAFSAEVGAKQGEWQGFTAQVQGEAARQQAYETEVRAYGQEVQAYSTQIQAYKAQVEAAVSRNEGAYKVYLAAVQAYTAQVQAASEESRAEVAVFDAQVKGSMAKNSAEEAKGRLAIAKNESLLRAGIAQYETDSRIVIANSQMYNQYMIGAANVAVHAAGVYANMAGSAMAGINALGADINTTTSK